MEFYFRRITISSYIIVCILLKHASTGGVQIDVDCMGSGEPYCCRTKCEWNEKPSKTFKDANCIVKEKNMECKTNSGDKNFSTPSIPNGIIDKDARCKIHLRESDYVVSCYYYKSKPICCETPCKWELKFDNATCQMTETKIDCSYGTGDNPKHLELCFEKSLCPHKPEDTTCNFGPGDMCYIYTDDGKRQTQGNAERILKPEDVTTPTVTETPPSNQTDVNLCCIIGITTSICILVICCVICCGIAYCLKKKCIICCSCCVKRTVSNDPPEMDALNQDNQRDN
ncbi:uncharacterized protein LOC125246326 [Megalobrama amblycephala]|uniref:uncharacterized protein LOC125246326 n=1 Tax=Megalobrama amblycephala TaxID=75352 RepID=UPI00201405FE|nr:uncharacterized protein LOC125246326 [Megalobrama amblycephala]